MVYFPDPVVYIYTYVCVSNKSIIYSLQYVCIYVCVFMSAHPIGYNVTGSAETLHVCMQILTY